MTAKKKHAGNPEVDKWSQEIDRLHSVIKAEGEERARVVADRDRLSSELQSTKDKFLNTQIQLRNITNVRMQTRKVTVVFTSGESTEIEYFFRVQRGWWHFQQTQGGWIRLNPANIAYFIEHRPTPGTAGDKTHGE